MGERVSPGIKAEAYGNVLTFLSFSVSLINFLLFFFFSFFSPLHSYLNLFAWLVVFCLVSCFFPSVFLSFVSSGVFV